MTQDQLNVLLGFAFNAVMEAESLFGPKTGILKRRDSWVKVLQSLYDVLDFFSNFESHIDMIVKFTVIPTAIDMIVAYLNKEGFVPENKEQALLQVASLLKTRFDYMVA